MHRKAFYYYLLLAAMVTLTIGGCTTAKEQKPFLYLIFDATGSFQQWLPEAMQTAYYILDKVLVNPGAQVCVAIIDDHSYPSDNVLLGPIQMSDLPLKFKAEKRKLLEAFSKLQVPVSQVPGTDIQGALHRAAEYAAVNPSDWIDILMFCDMQEEHNPVQYQPVRFAIPVRLTVFFMPQLKIVYRDASGKKVMRDETQEEFSARQQKWRNIFAAYGLPGAQYVTFYDPSQSRVTGGLASTSIEAAVAALSKAPQYASAGAGQAAQQGPPMPPPGMPQQPPWEAAGPPAPPIAPPEPGALPPPPSGPPPIPPPSPGEPPA